MHLTMETNNNSNNISKQLQDTRDDLVNADDPPIVDFSLPITTVYLNHLKARKGGRGTAETVGGDIGGGYLSSSLVPDYNLSREEVRAALGSSNL